MGKKEIIQYETIFIVDALFEDEKIENIVNKYTNLLKKNKAEIVKIDKWGRKKFASPIRRKLSGYYVSIEFKVHPSTLSKLEKAYNLDDNILRYVILSYDKSGLEKKNKYMERKSLELEKLAKEAENIIIQELPSSDSTEKVSSSEESVQASENQ